MKEGYILRSANQTPIVFEAGTALTLAAGVYQIESCIYAGGPNGWRCKSCRQHFSNADEARHHGRTTGHDVTEAKELKCQRCDQVFSSGVDLQQHERITRHDIMD